MQYKFLLIFIQLSYPEKCLIKRRECTAMHNCEVEENQNCKKRIDLYLLGFLLLNYFTNKFPKCDFLLYRKSI